MRSSSVSTFAKFDQLALREGLNFEVMVAGSMSSLTLASLLGRRRHGLPVDHAEAHELLFVAEDKMFSITVRLVIRDCS